MVDRQMIRVWSLTTTSDANCKTFSAQFGNVRLAHSGAPFLHGYNVCLLLRCSRRAAVAEWEIRLRGPQGSPAWRVVTSMPTGHEQGEDHVEVYREGLGEEEADLDLDGMNSGAFIVGRTPYRRLSCQRCFRIDRGMVRACAGGMMRTRQQCIAWCWRTHYPRKY